MQDRASQKKKKWRCSKLDRATRKRCIGLRSSQTEFHQSNSAKATSAQIHDHFAYTLDILSEFWRSRPEIKRFLAFWHWDNQFVAQLLLAIRSRRQHRRDREFSPTVRFSLGLSREVLMFVVRILQINNTVETARLEIFLPRLVTTLRARNCRDFK